MTTKSITEQVLDSDERSRNDDKYLITQVFKRKGWDMTPHEIEMFFSMPSTESIRRTRQTAQAAGLYPASDKIKKFRTIKSQEIKQSIPTASPTRVEDLMEQRTVISKPKPDPFMDF